MGILERLYLYENEERQLKIFCDMDGVICWWEKAFENLGNEVTKGLEGHKFEDKYGREELWKVIAENGKLEFWSEMPWTPDGKKLWNYIKKYNPTILTTPARSKFCKEGKKIWIKRELGEDVPYIFSKDKYEHADMESVLIDDYDKKINDWINKGDGIGIYHQNADDTIKQLKQLGF